MSTVHHQEYLNTVYTATGICHSSSVGVCLRGRLTSVDLASRRQQNWNDKYLLCVYSVEILLMMDSGHVRNMYCIKQI